MNKKSKLGYKRYSPDVNNPYNIIPSGRITMKDVDFPVYGVDEYGNSQIMYPGAEYQFPGNQVFEIPMAQAGLQIPQPYIRPDFFSPQQIQAAEQRLEQDRLAAIRAYATPASGRIEGEGLIDAVLPAVATPILKAVAKPISNLTADLSQAALRQFSRPVENVAMGNVDKVIADLATARHNQLFKLKGSVHDKRVKLGYHRSNPIILDRSQKIPTKRGTSFTLKEEPVFYRTTTPEKFERIMDPISTVGNPHDRAQNLRFFTPNRNIARNYMDVYNHGDLAISARMNVKNPYFQNPRALTNEYVQDKIAQGYDAIVTHIGGRNTKLRDAYEIIPLDKQLLYDIQKLERFQRGGKLLYNPGSDTYYGPELEEAVVIGEKSKDYPYADQLDERSRQYWRENYSDKNNAIVRGIKSRARIGDKKGLYGELESLANNALTTAAEFSGLAGSAKFSQDPKANLIGAGQAIENFLLGTNPMASSFLNTKITPEQSEQFFNTLDAAGVFGAATAPLTSAGAKAINATKVARALGTESGLLSNTYKLNPFATKLNKYNRVVGKDAIDDIATSNLVRTGKPSDKIPSKPGMVNLDRRGTTSYPSFSEAPSNTYINQLTAKGKDPYIISTNRSMKPSTLGRHGAGTTLFPVDESGSFLRSFPAEEAQVFNNKPHWLKGYQEIPLNRQIGGSLYEAQEGIEVEPASRRIRFSEGQILKKDWWSGYKPVNISRKRYQQGGLVKAQFGIQTAAFMPMMAQAYGAASSWFNDDSKPAATPAPAVPEIVDWRKLSRPKQIDYAIGELTAFEKEENRKALENLLESTAYMENRYGEDPGAYGRNYTSSFMSIDPIALKDMFTGRGANGAYNSAQRRQFETFKQLDLPTDQKQFDALLREDNPVAAMAAARYRYALVPQALPSANDQQGMFDYWLKYYNGSGILKHKTRAEAYKDFQRAYQQALSND